MLVKRETRSVNSSTRSKYLRGEGSQGAVVQVLDTLSTFFSTTKGTHPTEGNDTLGAGFLRYMACASKC